MSGHGLSPRGGAPLDPRVVRAIEMFRESPVGRQLSVVEEQAGRCKHASGGFVSALREAGTSGTLLEWGWEETSSWHHAVLLDDGLTVIDWTAAQFVDDPDARAAVPFPRIEPRSVAEERWGRATEIDL